MICLTNLYIITLILFLMIRLYRLNNLSSVLNSLTFRLSVRLSNNFTCISVATHRRHIENRLLTNSQRFVLQHRHIHSSVKILKKYEMYPAIEPFNSGHLEVSSVHKIYYEQCGNKNGLPIIFVHG